MSSASGLASLEEYRKFYQGRSDLEVQVLRLEDIIRASRDNSSTMSRRISQSEDTFLDVPFFLLLKEGNHAIAAFDYNRIDIEIIVVDSVDYYDEASHGPLPQAITDRLQQWNDDPDEFINWIKQKA